MHLPEALIWIMVFGGFTVQKLFKVGVLAKIDHLLFLVCPFMTAMTGDKGGGGVHMDPLCINKVAEYFGTIRVNLIHGKKKQY